jgi:hypothetical protein
VGYGLGCLVPERGAACGGHLGWAGGLAQMPQDRVHGRRRSQEGDDAHLRATQGALQGENLVDASQQQRPEQARGRGLGVLGGIAS